MKKENITEKYIEELENIKNKNNITRDNLEMLLSELKENQEELIQILMRLKSNIKSDEVVK